ncbi:MAG TPA: pantoate--beta-alanine ligase [Rudaea sp.]|jgi:pantoate--beta-alanine ligase|nr:pantoate--beta-alanine ligase [Rudaea sp.]
MDTVKRGDELRARTAHWKRAGERVGFVPTMGNLHNGHFFLISAARENADRVVASVFVNPTQFGPHEDFASYPRTLAQDKEGLERAGCDLLFAPDVEEMYPFGVANMVRVDVAGLSEILDGAMRPGHFSGVATVVAKLFNLVAPDVAVFGQKDYQQLLVIRRLTTDLRMPIEIVGAQTVREENGLAMSSRNQYLTGEERERASAILRTLNAMRDMVRAGKSVTDVESHANIALQTAGLAPDYAVVRRSDDLRSPGVGDRSFVALIAARLGKARLIDNLLFNV